MAPPPQIDQPYTSTMMTRPKSKPKSKNIKARITQEDLIAAPSNSSTLSQKLKGWWSTPVLSPQPPPSLSPSIRGGSFDGSAGQSNGQGSYPSSFAKEKQKSKSTKDPLSGPTYERNRLVVQQGRELVSFKRVSFPSWSNGRSFTQKDNGCLLFKKSRRSNDTSVQDGGILNWDQEPDDLRISYHIEDDGFVFVDVAEWDEGCGRGLLMESTICGRERSRRRLRIDTSLTVREGSEGLQHELPRLLGTIWTDDPSELAGVGGRQKAIFPVVRQPHSTGDLETELTEAMETPLPRLPVKRRHSGTINYSSNDIEDVPAMEDDPSYDSLQIRGESLGTTPRGEYHLPFELHKISSGESRGCRSPGMDSYFRMDAFLRDLSSRTPSSPVEEFSTNTHTSPVYEHENRRELLELDECLGGAGGLDGSLELVMEEYVTNPTDSWYACLDIEDLKQSQEEMLDIDQNMHHEPLFSQSAPDIKQGSGRSVDLMKDSGLRLCHSQSEIFKNSKRIPVPGDTCTLEYSGMTDETTSTMYSSGPQKEWWYGTSASSSESPIPGTRDWRDIPVPDGNLSPRLHLITAGDGSRPLLREGDSSSLHMRGGSGPGLGMWGGKGTAVSLFGIRRPVGDVERGKKLLDKSIGFGWYCAGGPRWGTTYRSANTLTKERFEEEKRLEIEKEEKKTKAAAKKEEKAKQKEELQKKNKGQGKTGLVTKLKASLSKSKDKGVAVGDVEGTGGVDGSGEGAQG